jgi:hypothetical protein|tara:strand:- start:242 stop:499 length:258 start_codon:yes stop_codon:yes gene_type:complete
MYLGVFGMKNWISTIKYYLRQFVELGVLLLAVSVFAELLFGPNVAFFGSQVTNNLITLLDSIGDQGVAALIIIFAVIFVYRKLLK